MVGYSLCSNGNSAAPSRSIARSISAPKFSIEDERQEKETLTEEEVESIHFDLFGEQDCEQHHGERASTSDVNQENKAEVDADPEQLRSLLRVLGAIPDSQKESYTKALTICPRIVQSESDANLFLRCLKGNAVLAARRLVEYWRMRELLFKERAFLPMTTTGALRDDAHLLESKIWEQLPEDTEGRAVMYYNCCGPTENERPTRDSVIRLLWYMVHKTMIEQEDPHKGFVIIVDARSCSLYTFDRKLVRRMTDSCTTILPVTIKALHVCCSPHRSVLEMICPMFKYMVGRHLRNRMVIHQANSKQDIVDDLEEYGISADGLPLALGGRLGLPLRRESTSLCGKPDCRKDCCCNGDSSQSIRSQRAVAA